MVVPLSLGFRLVCRSQGVRLTPNLLQINVQTQRMLWLASIPSDSMAEGFLRKCFRISTSRFGAGEKIDSNCTPRGLHRIARKVGGGWPVGAVFKSRRMMGYTWAGLPGAPITHRIFWLEGLEPGRNRGGDVDTFARYIYIHGTGDEPSIGRPASRGCIHLSANDLLPLYDQLPLGTLVWIC